MEERSFERYPNIQNANSPSFGPDGERISFLMDTTGVPQVWQLGAPEQWPQQLTFEEERISFASWSPERDELIFGMDYDGNEHVQLFRLDGNGETVTPLTATPDAIHTWGGWNSDGSKFAFTSNRRDESVFDVYIQSRNGSPNDAELVYESDGWLTVSDWSPDDSQLAVIKENSGFDRDVFILDIESGKIEQVTPTEDNVRYDNINWSPDGNSLYLTTNYGADTKYLARLDTASGTMETVVEGGRWNIEWFRLHKETNRFAFGKNVHGFTELTLGTLQDETSVQKFPDPDLPQGVFSDPSFDDSGEKLALTGQGSTENANVYVVTVKTGEVQCWTAAPTGGIPKDSFIEPELVQYSTFDGREIPALFSLPDSDTESGDTPAIVDIHGGPMDQRRPNFNRVRQYFLANDYAVLEPNVRGSTGYGRSYSCLDDVEKRMDAVTDIKYGVEWLRRQPAIDPDRIVAFGGSYGGFMVLAAMTEYPDLWAAGVDIMGIANFVTFLENTGDWRREHREAEYGSLSEDREFLKSISPINNIESIDSPLLVIHGENDPRVPVSETEQLVTKVSNRGVPVEQLMLEDEGHGFTKRKNLIEVYTKVMEFMNEYV